MTPAQIEGALDAATNETKIAVAAWVFKHLVEHAQHGGSFRELVYKRLKLGIQAYTPLLNAGGVSITTHFSLLGRREPTVDSARMPVLLNDKMMAAGIKNLRRMVERIGDDDFPVDRALGELWLDLLTASGRDAQPPDAPGVG